MKKINIKNPLTIFTSSLKVEGVNLIVEAEEVEVIEEEVEPMYFYVKNTSFDVIFTFILPSENITFNDYIFGNGTYNNNIDVTQVSDINNSAYLCIKGYEINPTNSSIYLSTSQNTLGNALANVSSRNVITKDYTYITSGSGGAIN